MRGSGFAFRHLYLSVPGWDDLPAAQWVNALARERELQTDTPEIAYPLRSLFVGGAGPEGLGVDLPRVVREVVGREALDGIAEWTVELSDPRIREEVVLAWISEGVTRLSLRGPAAAPGSVRRIARLCAGRTALGADLPLAADGPPGIEDRIEELIDLGAGSLAFVEADVASDGAPDVTVDVDADPDSGPPADPESTREAWLTAVQALRRAGWSFLDVAFAFGTPTCPVHPRAIARRNPILGLGPGAVTFRHPDRRWNHADLHSYLGAIRDHGAPVAGRESLTRAEGRFERCWTSLRSERGLRMPGPSCTATPWFERWEGANWVRSEVEGVVDTGRLRLAPEGWLMADGLAVELALELERIPPGGSTDHSEFQNFEE